MFRDPSRRITAALLVGTALLVAVAWRIRPAANHGPSGTRYRVLAPFAAGSIAGRVIVSTSGARPAFSSLPNPPGCAPRPFAAASNGGLAETVVTLLNVRAGIAPPASGPTLELDRCGFSPRVMVGLEGGTATVKVPQGDHRIQANLGEVRVFDASTTGNARIALPGEGLWTIRCASNHPAEQAWVYVSSNPYTVVTDRAGRFRLADVPAGRWILKAWNPAWGEVTSDVLVEVNRESNATVRY